MRYLLDTNTCIKFLNGTSSRIREHMAALTAEDIVLSSIVKAELFYGALKSGRPVKNMARLHEFFRRFVSLPFDDAAAEEYGVIRSQLTTAGTPIGPNDLCIAAIAKVNRLTLVTHNTGEFIRVAGLSLKDWE